MASSLCNRLQSHWEISQYCISLIGAAMKPGTSWSGLGETLNTPHETGPGSPRLRIMLADDNPALLLEFQRALAKDFEVVAMVPDGCALLELYGRLRPEVIVTDISMPLMDGFEVAAKLQGTPRLIFLTVHEELAFVEEAKALGAMGYVLKRSRPSVLVDAIRSAFEGRFYLCPELRE